MSANVNHDGIISRPGWRSYEVNCRSEGCDERERFEAFNGDKFRTRIRALGWKRLKGEWFCPDHAHPELVDEEEADAPGE